MNRTPSIKCTSFQIPARRIKLSFEVFTLFLVSRAFFFTQTSIFIIIIIIIIIDYFFSNIFFNKGADR